MKEAGIVGAGGAGFPAYAKLAPGADILLVNGAECEPLLYTDYIILSREMPMVLAGIKAVLEYADIPRALLCVKEHTAKRLNLKDGEKLADRISLKTLPDVYPMGDEISLIYQATGRIVKDDQGAPDFARSLGGGAVQAPRCGQIGGAGGDGVLSMHPLYGHVSAGASGISAGAAQNGAHGQTGGGNFPRDGAFGKPLLRLRRLREPRLLSGNLP